MEVSRAVWVKQTARRPSENATIISIPVGPDELNTWELLTNGAGDSLFVSGDGDSAGLLAGPPVPLNDWTHIAITFDGGTKRFYFNGELRGMEEAVVRWDDMHDIVVGGDENAGVYVNPFEGLMDELRLFDRAIDPAEVMLLYAAGGR